MPEDFNNGSGDVPFVNGPEGTGIVDVSPLQQVENNLDTKTSPQQPTSVFEVKQPEGLPSTWEAAGQPIASAINTGASFAEGAIGPNPVTATIQERTDSSQTYKQRLNEGLNQYGEAVKTAVNTYAEEQATASLDNISEKAEQRSEMIASTADTFKQFIDKVAHKIENLSNGIKSLQEKATNSVKQFREKDAEISGKIATKYQESKRAVAQGVGTVGAVAGGAVVGAVGVAGAGLAATGVGAVWAGEQIYKGAKYTVGKGIEFGEKTVVYTKETAEKITNKANEIEMTMRQKITDILNAGREKKDIFARGFKSSLLTEEVILGISKASSNIEQKNLDLRIRFRDKFTQAVGNVFLPPESNQSQVLDEIRNEWIDNIFALKTDSYAKLSQKIEAQKELRRYVREGV